MIKSQGSKYVSQQQRPQQNVSLKRTDSID